MNGAVREMFGLGKNRSKLGKYIDKNGITQTELSKKSGVSRATIVRLCSGDAFMPNMKTAARVIKALRELVDPNVSTDKFWDV
jgi:putative transcriptional regulator